MLTAKEVFTWTCKVLNPDGSGPRICAVDCGLKYNQLRCLIARDARVELVPWNHPLDPEKYDGLFLSNGPGDPKMCNDTVKQIMKVLKTDNKSRHSSSKYNFQFSESKKTKKKTI